MSDEYACVSKGKLKLKNDTDLKKKKKKNKGKDKEREALQKSYVEQQIAETSTSSSATAVGSGYERKLTKAELASKKQQEKMRNKRIMDKAQTTHKERVEKFNEHLDSLTEHFDIPKVSWTK
ncbi:GL15165 [Drosophila persimilis]|uniref:Protein FAM32A-like n=2 Tax=pseudoobscura subgroup TaxID=32358 RepID=Q29LJ7_DROPS|nr:protein FAM32A-like [Drosophila pseudoobscura]XP_002020628.1 protein FAM32A-like [Drosophila persimilis]EDW39621.1 GL15165 [Drosophila persimilis]